MLALSLAIGVCEAHQNLVEWCDINVTKANIGIAHLLILQLTVEVGLFIAKSPLDSTLMYLDLMKLVKTVQTLRAAAQ